MEFNVLKYKRYQEDGKGNTILDLTKSSIEKYAQISDARTFIVTKQYEMRPDLISLAVYGTDEYADFIMKRNEVSNPFSIAEGDILVIPVRESFENALRPPADEPTIEESEPVEFVIETKSTVDKARLEALQEKADNKILPPNINDTNEENIIITSDKILLGQSVTGVCNTTSSRVKLKMSLQEKHSIR